jgi:hypothetical protein
VIADRAAQAVVLNALEPEWEARFEPRSYGFRPGRGCHDAIEAIYTVCKGKSPARAWVLDADLTAVFDRIDHDRLLDHLHGFPAKERVARWLKAGVVENRQYTPTAEGTPQGGVITPPTQWVTRLLIALRVGAGGVVWVGGGGAFADGDAVSDGDFLGSDEDVFDEQSQYALAFGDGGDLDLVAELGEESVEVVGEFEVAVAVGELGVDVNRPGFHAVFLLAASPGGGPAG